MKLQKLLKYMLLWSNTYFKLYQRPDPEKTSQMPLTDSKRVLISDGQFVNELLKTTIPLCERVCQVHADEALCRL